MYFCLQLNNTLLYINVNRYDVRVRLSSFSTPKGDVNITWGRRGEGNITFLWDMEYLDEIREKFNLIQKEP